jgi:hypothetical protein
MINGCKNDIQARRLRIEKTLILFAVWGTILSLRVYLEEHAEPIMFLLALESYFNQLKAI